MHHIQNIREKDMETHLNDADIINKLATTVMGWIPFANWPEGIVWDMQNGESYPDNIHDHWQPLTNIAHAWQVVERMREKGFLYRIIDVDDHEVQFYRHNQVWSVADSSLCFAIALAALKVIAAVEGE